ncbi:MAG TPA: choice-of-anchor Q domain-containing protein [Pyrinomonadaceae bacterium]|jgi:hypothetical protein|nr:choice-of-anchor Q domain-containing protein [Pyrinomonadaceae bacterium]
MNKKSYFVIGAIFLMLGLTTTSKATLLVSNTNNSGAGSLRDAVDHFNNDISGASDAIIFSNAFNSPQTITLSSEIVISGFGGSLSINGPGANLLTIHMSGTTDRVFRSRTSLTLKDMILEFGQGGGSLSGANGKGSAIYFDGTTGGSLTLDRVIVQNNDSTFFSASTGAIYFFGGSNHRITNSTFTANKSANCGAFDGQSYTLSVTNSTISGNSVSVFGGGLCVPSGSTKFRSSTIANNTAGTAGGGIFVQNGTLDLGNTIVARNSSGSFPDFRYFGGTVVTAGTNLIGNNTSVEFVFPTGINPPNQDRSGDSTTPLDPLFAPLSNYGGTTPTLALSNGSPAIDHGGNIPGATPGEDQRGVTRDNFIDIGAFEFNAAYLAVLQHGVIGQVYSLIITQNNSGYNYCVSSGALPPGLSGIPNCPAARPNTPFSPQAAVVITGTPTSTGPANFAITTTNGNSSQTTKYLLNIVSPTATNGIISGRIVDQLGNPLAGAVVKLEGSANRKLITDADGSYRFDDVETGGFYTLTPARVNYTFSPSARSFSQMGQTTEAVFTAITANAAFINPLDTSEYFVRQHYLDFLGREPEETGFNFWSDQLLACGVDAGCLERRRINVSAAYFLSIEFQETAGLVDGLYRVSYGRRPLYAEFLPDRSAIANGLIVGRSGWQQELETNKRAFVDAWIQRPSFRAAYDGLSNEAYVAQLVSHTGINYPEGERDLLISGLTSNTLSRADVLRRIVENQSFARAKFNEAFVMMEYFGYLRRDPDESGYQFWLRKLNDFGGNFEQAEMVKAFISSGEYRARFGP